MSCECDTTVLQSSPVKDVLPFIVSVLLVLLQLLCCMWKDRMFTSQNDQTRRRLTFHSVGLTSSHPVRVLVPPPLRPSMSKVSIGNRNVVDAPPPTIIGCMLCFVRVESHDNLGMNILFRKLSLLVCSRVCSELRELPVRNIVRPQPDRT